MFDEIALTVLLSLVAAGLIWLNIKVKGARDDTDD